MDLIDVYRPSYWAIAFIILLLLLQWFIATRTKASQGGAIPGKIDSSLGHESFVFRAHRTFMNTLENMPAMLATCFLAILVHANPRWTAVFIWAFVVCRVIHMVLYYAIATEKNPSPRTYFFMLGLLCNLALLALCITALLVR